MTGRPRTLFLSGSAMEFLSIHMWNIQQSGNEHPRKNTFREFICSHDSHHARIVFYNIPKALLVVEYNNLVISIWSKSI